MNTYPTTHVRVSALPDGIALARYLMTLGESRGDSHRAFDGCRAVARHAARKTTVEL
jgi:hypothetical protein